MKGLIGKIVLNCAVLLAVLAPVPVLATSHTPADVVRSGACEAAATPAAKAECLNGKDFFGGGAFRNIANALIFVLGAIAVLMVIIGGFKYVLSGGDPGGIKSAKDTIMYAIIGVIVAVMSFALVNFVITNVNK